MRDIVTDEITGITILDFKVKMKNTELFQKHIPIELKYIDFDYLLKIYG